MRREIRETKVLKLLPAVILKVFQNKRNRKKSHYSLNQRLYRCDSMIFTVFLFSMFCLQKMGVTCSQDIFHGSTIALEKIMVVEKDIRTAVEEYVVTLERRIEIAKRYLQDSQKSDKNSEKVVIQNGDSSSYFSSEITISQKERVLFNPLKVFKLIRNLAITLPSLEKDLQRDEERRFLRNLESVRKGVTFPQQADLNSATEGLLRVQDAYDLDVFSFANGDFEGLSTNSSLNAADCFIIGSYSLSANIFTRAIEWLERAYHLVHNEPDTSISSQTVWKQLKDAVSRHNSALISPHLPKSQHLFRDPVDSSHGDWKKKLGTRRRKRLDNPTYPLYMTEPSFTDLTNFAALCRGEQLQAASSQKNLVCWLDRRSPHAILLPIRVELLHEKPQVLQIYDILPASLSSGIISATSATLSRSRVHGSRSESHKLVSAQRTSSSTWMHDAKVLKKMGVIYTRLQSLLGLDLKSKGACEHFQVSSYNSCGHYNPHLDNILKSKTGHAMEKAELDLGDRLATLMFYLSDVPRGGFSAFPRLGIVTRPVKGSAVFWFNEKINGDVEPLSLHGGCPVLYGNKWIANQWIRANSQMFARKCSKDNTKGSSI